MHICHLTVLNPALHSRIFYKWAKSQQRLGNEVTIIGQSERTEEYLVDHIRIIPINTFSRLSLKRVSLSLRYALILRKIGADALIIHSPELIPLAALFLMLGKKVHYDVHEDYAETILYAQHYPKWLKKPMAWVIRKLEKRAAKHFHSISYAERSYENILGLPKKKYHIVRNTFAAPEDDLDPLQIPFKEFMLYTGTLAEEWGLWESLSLWKQLNEHREIALIIAGHTHHKAIPQKIQEFVDSSKLRSLFKLIGGNSYVPYQHIIQLIKQAKFGTALYHPLPWIRHKIPTKFYEYMAFDVPLLYTATKEWEIFDQQYKLGIPLKGQAPDRLFELLEQWEHQHSPESYSWITDELVVGKITKQLSH